MATITQKNIDLLVKIVNSEFTQTEKRDIIIQHKTLYNLGIKLLSEVKLKNHILACECFNKIINSVDATEYLLLNSNPRISKEIYINSMMNLGNYIKTIVEALINEKLNLLNQNNATRTKQIDLGLTQFEKNLFNKSLLSFIGILQIEFEHEQAIQQITSLYSQLTYFTQNNFEHCLNYLNQSLMFSPCNPIIHYNLGHIYQKMNKLEQSLIHYKLGIKLNEHPPAECENDVKVNIQLTINCLNGIASIYRGLKKWPESLYFLLKANLLLSHDPDINNQLGVVYTEMRETNLAENHYKLAIQHYTQTFISTDPKFLLSEIFLNFGHMYSYNGDNNMSIECYNKSLKIVPKFALPYQNKLMNLVYIFDQLDDKMYITNQHKLINKLYAKNPKPYIFDENYFNLDCRDSTQRKIHIGIVSGDFANHPVSFFISTYLKNFDNTRFKVTCFSESIIQTENYNKNLNFKIIKNMSQENASNLIYNDNIHILLDLAGHTAGNRLDIFSFKPAPIQISYIGYPFSTGLNEIDYRITDNICDGNFSISQKFYTEKLIALQDAFMCYDYHDIDNMKENKLPEITDTPRLKNSKELIIGNFNRINKITDTVIIEFNKILLAHANVKFLFKTKALINLKICKEFVNKFAESVRDRIIILDCTLSHYEHIETYNKVDICIDTWPYSGTTTSCEALSMGCPVFSLYDSEYFLHPQNVTCSILKNSDLDFYVCDNTKEIIDKIQILKEKPIEYWKTLKSETRNKFLNGKFCDQKVYMKNIEELFVKLFNKHKQRS